MKRKDYEKELGKLQVELCHLQEWVKENKLRVIILFEGRDAAGKGGTIKAITETVSPRVFRVAALPAPSDRENTQLFLQRYMQHFPAAGDRDLRPQLVQPRRHERFLLLCPQMEKYIIEGGVILIKLWLKVGMDEQERRFKARINDPLRQWKLSPMDLIPHKRVQKEKVKLPKRSGKGRYDDQAGSSEMTFVAERY
ncbi:polyphosphate kinase 2 family protein [Bradyrhizobium sp. AUGA SZCCT0182]|uniref:polyphosphate kinase 2 family protein n=1 Tax=Bradyrhizobium sp. AUGA SZCCT0182 TaxID=2807667 RepID=UPI002012D28D|nr:polyphosphate kinase 2 [Bradyrhizobium sp. AUGA SZCCT0182]